MNFAQLPYTATAIINKIDPRLDLWSNCGSYWI